MNIKKIEGTKATTNLITNVLKPFQKEKPPMKHVDYSVSLVNKNNTSELIATENNGKLDNVSIINIDPNYPITKSIKAIVNNTTGAIYLEEKPFPVFMSTKRVLKKVHDFLTAIQPENRAKALKTTKDVQNFNNSENALIIKSKDHFKKFDIVSTVDASNYKIPNKAFEPYKALQA